MSADSYLQRIRQDAHRESYADGLLEVVTGVVFFIVALATGRPAFYWTYLAAILVLGPGLQRLKARFTYPRVGFAELPRENPRHFKWGVASWVISAFLLVALVLTLTGHVTDNLAWRRAAPALGGMLFAGGFVYVARRSQCWRHWLLAAVSVIGGLVLVWPTASEPYGNLRLWALIMALICLAVGSIALWRFTHDHPIIEQRIPDEQ
jgi:hypothetical protein